MIRGDLWSLTLLVTLEVTTCRSIIHGPHGPRLCTDPKSQKTRIGNCGTPVLKGCQELSFTITRFLFPQSSSLLPPRGKLLSLPPFLGWGGGPASCSLSKKVGKAKTKIVICRTNLPSLTFDVNLKTEVASCNVEI